MPANVIFLSSAFPEIYKKAFLKTTEIVSFVNDPKFKISEESFQYSKLVKKIKHVLCLFILNIKFKLQLEHQDRFRMSHKNRKA